MEIAMRFFSDLHTIGFAHNLQHKQSSYVYMKSRLGHDIPADVGNLNKVAKCWSPFWQAPPTRCARRGCHLHTRVECSCQIRDRITIAYIGIANGSHCAVPSWEKKVEPST